MVDTRLPDVLDMAKLFDMQEPETKMPHFTQTVSPLDAEESLVPVLERT
jgi:hypothetical protein